MAPYDGTDMPLDSGDVQQLIRTLEDLTGAVRQSTQATAHKPDRAAAGGSLSSATEGAQKLADNGKQLVAAAKVLEDAADSFGDGLSSALADAVLNAEDLGDALENLAQQLLSDVLRNLIFAPLGGNVGSFLGGLIPGRAGGGRIGPMSPVLVGERGPELIMSARPATVVNTADSRKLMGAAGGQPIVQNMTFTSDVKDTVRAEILNAMPVITQNVLQAMRHQQHGVR